MSERRAAYRIANEMPVTEYGDEGDQQAAIIRWADEQCATHPELDLLNASLNGIKLGGSSKQRARTIAKAKREGMRVGYPDLFLPVARNGWHGLFIELKHRRNKPTPEQVQWLDRLTEQGYLATACWEAHDAINVISEYLNLQGR
jgi:hypothetical protein